MINCRCQCHAIRCVPPFSYRLSQRCTRPVCPPRIPIYRRQPPCRSLFRKFFLRGDIPISRYFGPNASKQFIKWHVPAENLDYQRYLPLFFDGLCERTFPYREFARNGARDMIAVAKEKQLLCCLPMLILPAKRALHTKDPDVIIATLRVLQQLVQAGPRIGQCLVPYYRQLLPMLNLFCTVNVNLGDKIDFQGGHRLGDVICETLATLERTGGKDAYLNIKYMVPTYESCVLNK
ncbi:parkin coregulated gene protein-like [Toxorhynchites rutilus septentrionalis]|uniref:parkin coregulated gene protein-like n=1 Tax=Toxorhynchites rutilus septentrionalis TaxID=329112 RepID=UPI00247904AB|nr:parkin coregulated gene protein-like [Toxorhynchites rutilus septentrionalis]XP_055618730.1 parkin coregulated gene protein-like [Toxorhynchites rutilus septentrionalis]